VRNRVIEESSVKETAGTVALIRIIVTTIPWLFPIFW